MKEVFYKLAESNQIERVPGTSGVTESRHLSHASNDHNAFHPLSFEVRPMARITGACGVFALLLGAFMLVEGIWGLTSPIVFGVFSTNLLHASIHIVLGLVGIGVAMRGGARRYCLLIGILLLVVGALWFVPGAGDLVRTLLNANHAVALFNLVVGGIALALALQAPRIRR